jgi:hypothetical protein
MFLILLVKPGCVVGRDLIFSVVINEEKRGRVSIHESLGGNK